MGKKKGRVPDMESNEVLRLQMLRCVLEARSMEFMVEKFGVTEKGIKFRLTNLYKYYGVKSKYELMAKFIELPEEVLLAGAQVNEDYTPVELAEGESIELKEPLTEEDVVTPSPEHRPGNKSDNIWS